jgi:hypothetical protein
MRGVGRVAGVVVLGLLLALGASPARAASEIVVAIRYLLPKGVSHAHLYLYREDGKLLRQLTNDNSGQDRDPVFSPKGESIVFTRTKPGNRWEFWSVDPHGGKPRRLKKAPAWYKEVPIAPTFTFLEEDTEPGTPKTTPAVGQKAPHVRTPDGKMELVLRVDPADASQMDVFQEPGRGRHYLLRDLKTRQEIEFQKLPGFDEAYELLHHSENARKRFLWEGALRVAFFERYMGSTDGVTIYALDLSGRRFVHLSPHGAMPIPLPGEPAFLTLTFERYVSISGSTMTANCSYIDHWNAKLRKVRYAQGGAAVCYGASLHRPGRRPAVVTIRNTRE